LEVATQPEFEVVVPRSPRTVRFVNDFKWVAFLLAKRWNFILLAILGDLRANSEKKYSSSDLAAVCRL